MRAPGWHDGGAYHLIGSPSQLRLCHDCATRAGIDVCGGETRLTSLRILQLAVATTQWPR
ncbi:hypothetical protein I552_2737 [Mycobacterium xenopi 3993]|nr:hypothetical protein I552_2737 [Mycobacterium xenopi 3993]